MKLEVGMYVRFDYHRVTIPIQISKIILIEYDDVEKYYMYHTANGLVITDDNLVNEPSHNIIDLIEVGDYVNGYYVEDICETFINIAIGSNYFQKPTIFEQEIKSIVTKEQFESVSYKIGE